LGGLESLNAQKIGFCDRKRSLSTSVKALPVSTVFVIPRDRDAAFSGVCFGLIASRR
jgi:hypothetical protein